MTYASFSGGLAKRKKNLASRMKRQAPYADPRINVYSHSEHMDAPKQQQEMGINKYTGRSDFIHTQDGHISHPSNFESRWEKSHSGNQMSNSVPSHLEDHGKHRRRSYYQQCYTPNANPNSEKQDNTEAAQHEQDMEIGYGDSPLVLTFDGLERKFNDEILAIVKEQSDLEDAEITRHKERLIEINSQYQQKLSSIRTRQAAQRQEFLQKESDTRLYQYQKPGMKEHANSLISGGSHRYGGVAHEYNLPAPSAEAARPYGSSAAHHFSPHGAGDVARGYRDPHVQFESYGEQSYRGSMKTEDSIGRVPYPEGRVYNRGSRYH